MNTVTRNTFAIALVSAAFGAFSGSALAQEATYELPQPAVSTVKRADVRAELLQARRDGTLLATEADFQKNATFVAGKSRATVTAEARAASVQSHAAYGEPHGFDGTTVAVFRAPSTRMVASAAR